MKITKKMKINKTLIYVVVSVCAVFVFLIPFAKRLFDQIPDYKWDTQLVGNTKSKEPFGAKYLAEYLQEYWKGKKYVETNVDTALAKYGQMYVNYLFVGSGEQSSDSTTIARYIGKANVGNRLLFAGLDAPHIIENLLINIENEDASWGVANDFNINDFLNNPSEMHRITLYFKNMKEAKRPHTIKIWKNMATCHINSALDADSSFLTYSTYYDCYGNIPHGSYTSLIAKNGKRDIAARRDIGKGCITICSSFAFFTNYAVKDDDLRIGMEHIMEATFDKSLPLVIIYNNEDMDTSDRDKEDSMFGVLLQHPSTSLFLWLLCIALVLAIFVNGRRRRRAETVRKKAHNSSINYIKHLATIYTDETDYSELLRIEKQVLLYRLRKEFYFDMRTRDYTEVSQFAEHIATTKGLRLENVKEVLNTLEELTASGVEVDARSYRLCLGQLSQLKMNNDSNAKG